MWVAKILAPPESEDNAQTKQFLKIAQAALMEGWLSNIPFISAILVFASVVVGFFCHWWFGILIFFLAAFLGVLAKLLFMRSVSHYLPLLHHKMLNREVDYQKQNDIERAEAAQSYCKDLVNLMQIYQNSSVRPPTAKQLAHIPYGDLYYWLEDGATNA
ncbi:MAG: hypothetical protein ACMG5Z_05445 [Luteimonas sp.]